VYFVRENDYEQRGLWGIGQSTRKELGPLGMKDIRPVKDHAVSTISIFSFHLCYHVDSVSVNDKGLLCCKELISKKFKFISLSNEFGFSVT